MSEYRVPGLIIAGGSLGDMWYTGPDGVLTRLVYPIGAVEGEYAIVTGPDGVPIWTLAGSGATTEFLVVFDEDTSTWEFVFDEDGNQLFIEPE